jgi:hypothetical protein
MSASRDKAELRIASIQIVDSEIRLVVRRPPKSAASALARPAQAVRYDLTRELGLCLSEIKLAHTDDGARQEKAWAQCDQRRVLFAASARPC